MKNKLRSLTIITLMFTVFLIFIPVVSAKTRQSYLADFLFQNQIGNEQFGNSYKDTSYALEIINYYDLYETKVDKQTFIENLEIKLQEMFDNGEIDLYELYYLLSSLDILNELDTLDSNYKDKIHEYINQTEQISGGYAITNTSTSANLVSTYLVYNIYSLLEEPIFNQTTHLNWILSCNNTDGGYGGNQTLPSTIVTTYCAVYLVSKLTTVDDLENKTATLNYIFSFYCDDPLDSDNYGGFFPDLIANNALLSSTYYCIESIELIDDSTLNPPATTDWILDRQNFQDGGFVDDPSEHEEGLSSIPATYHAFKILYILNALDHLNQDVFMIEFNYIILIIVLSVIGIIAVIIVIIWRKRKL
ncbi:MAG: prenyltransferase/squalene oxidase repeat-containing protein [Candidatus Hermodarchaeota archaeon]